MMQEQKKMKNSCLEATKRLVIDRKGIGFFKAILESYEDVAIFSVLDGHAGLIEIVYPSHFENDVIGIIQDMKHYGIEFKEADNV